MAYHKRESMDVSRDSRNVTTYISTTLRNSGNLETIPANFNSTATADIVDVGHDYLFSIERLNVPLTGIPYFFLQDTSGNNLYSITLKHPASGAFNQTFLIPDPSWSPIPNGVWELQQLADILNTALNTSFAALGVLPVGSPTVAPLVTYSGQSNLFSFKVPVEYLPSNANVVEIYFNYNLHAKMNSFPFKYIGLGEPNGESAKLFVYDSIDNLFSPTVGSDYYNISQQYVSVSKLSDIESLIMTTGHMPLGLQVTMSSDKTSQVRLPIITDFKIAGAGLSIDSYTDQVEYIASNQRWVDVIGNRSVRTIEYTIFYSTKMGEIYPLNIVKGDSVSAIFQFRKKDYIT